ncbi:MAG: glutathione peroxidase [candidate division Zixibacteria bacterium]|nr:glutathione peroxidase [candidate division Zixibacteria bacterium]
MANEVINYRTIAFNTIGGEETSLAEFSGQALLVVNVASKCGYTPQYQGLQALYEKYSDQGLTVIGFPANNFGKQEPGTNEEILQFCQSQFAVSFPMMAKVSVKGDDQHPLFTYLTENTDPSGDIPWNFHKFLLDREGNIVARFEPGVEPLSDELTGAIEKIL